MGKYCLFVCFHKSEVDKLIQNAPGVCLVKPNRSGGISNTSASAWKFSLFEIKSTLLDLEINVGRSRSYMYIHVPCSIKLHSKEFAVPVYNEIKQAWKISRFKVLTNMHKFYTSDIFHMANFHKEFHGKHTYTISLCFIINNWMFPRPPNLYNPC